MPRDEARLWRLSARRAEPWDYLSRAGRRSEVETPPRRATIAAERKLRVDFRLDGVLAWVARPLPLPQGLLPPVARYRCQPRWRRSSSGFRAKSGVRAGSVLLEGDTPQPLPKETRAMKNEQQIETPAQTVETRAPPLFACGLGLGSVKTHVRGGLQSRTGREVANRSPTTSTVHR